MSKAPFFTLGVRTLCLAVVVVACGGWFSVSAADAMHYGGDADVWLGIDTESIYPAERGHAHFESEEHERIPMLKSKDSSLDEQSAAQTRAKTQGTNHGRSSSSLFTRFMQWAPFRQQQSSIIEDSEPKGAPERPPKRMLLDWFKRRAQALKPIESELPLEAIGKQRTVRAIWW